MLTVTDEIHRKALDVLAGAHASYEAGRMSGETLKAVVEAVWGVTGGVIRDREFNDLFSEFSREAGSIPVEARIRLLWEKGRAVAIIREGETVTIEVLRRQPGAGVPTTFDMDDEAIEYALKIEGQCKEKGMVLL